VSVASAVASTTTSNLQLHQHHGRTFTIDTHPISDITGSSNSLFNLGTTLMST
jgi:hypothetical protein